MREEDLDDLIDWIFREGEVYRKNGERVRTRQDMEEWMREDAANLAAERRREGRAA